MPLVSAADLSLTYPWQMSVCKTFTWAKAVGDTFVRQGAHFLHAYEGRGTTKAVKDVRQRITDIDETMQRDTKLRTASVPNSATHGRA